MELVVNVIIEQYLFYLIKNIQFLGDINEELSNEKKNEGYYSEDFAYKYIKVNLHDRIEKGIYIFKIFFYLVGKNDEAKPGQERINVIVRTQIDGCDQEYIIYILNV